MNIQQFSEAQVVAYQAPLKALLRICVEKNFPDSLPEAFYTEKIEALEQYLREGRAYFFAAVEDTALLGFLWACEMASPFGRKFHVLYFAVCPDARGKGFGRALLREAEAQAKKLGIAQMELIVSQNNEEAVRFYQGQSYQTSRLVLTKALD